MVRKRLSSAHSQAQVAEVVSDSRQTVSRTVISTEQSRTHVDTSGRDRSPVFVYEEDRWELSPKTDYTYSRTVTYSPIVYPTNQSMWPNMSRRGLRSQCGEPCGYLLASSSSQATTESSSSSYDVHAHAGRKTKRMSDVTDAGSGAVMVNKRVQTQFQAGSSSSRSLASTALQQQTSIDKTLAHTSSSRQVTDKTMKHLYAGLDQSDDEALYADVGQRTLYTEHYVSLWRRILTFLVTMVLFVWTIVTKPVQMLVSYTLMALRTMAYTVYTSFSSRTSSHSARSASSQISVEVSTGRHAGHGDSLETSVVTTSSISRWQQFVTSVRSATYFCLITCPADVLYVLSRVALSPLFITDTAARYCWQALMWTVCSMSRYSAAVDNHILSITARGRGRGRSHTWCSLLLLVFVPFIFIVGYYLLWCGGAGTAYSSVTYDNFQHYFPFVGYYHSKESGAISASSAFDDRSHAVDQSGGATVAGGAMMSSCSCGDQTGAAGAGLGADQVEQMISDKLAALMAVNTESVDGKLATLHADLRSWTQQLVMAELANKQQATDAQLLAVADRSADNKKYAEFESQQLTFSARFDELNGQLADLEARLKVYSDELTLAKNKLHSNDEQSASHGALITSMKDDFDRLRADVEDLRLKHKDLIERTTACCLSKAQLESQIRAGINDHLMMLGGAAGSTSAAEDKESAEHTRAALIAWLGSQYVDRNELETRLAALARDVSDDLNTKVDEAAVLAAAAAVASASSVDSDRGKTDYIAGSGDDHSADTTVGIVGIGGSAQRNCTLCAGAITQEEVLNLIHGALNIYDADKTGKVDFALESAGGSVVSTRCSQTFQPRTAQLSLFGIPLWYSSNSPRVAIQPGVQPGECWAFNGSEGYLVVQLSAAITVTEVSIEHIPVSLAPSGNIDSAPRDFTIWGLQGEEDVSGVLLGNFTYSTSEPPLQSFPVYNDGIFPLVELQIHSNHGHSLFTCLYRFRVHGRKPHH